MVGAAGFDTSATLVYAQVVPKLLLTCAQFKHKLTVAIVAELCKRKEESNGRAPVPARAP